MKKIIVLLFVGIIMLQNVAFAVYIDGETEYVWSEKTIQTVASEDTQKDFLNLSCESAILIEQTTRKHFI